MRSVLIFIEWYTPANLAGGPIQAVQNIVKHLSHSMQIWIYTSAYDLGDNKIMKNIEADVWLNLSATTRVYYQSKKDVRLIDLKRMVLSINPDVIYLNSMFSKHFVIDFLLIRLFEKCNRKVILSPRGMLKQSALKKKWFKKWTYLRFARFFGLYNDIQFNASNEEEKIEILRVFPNARVTIIADIPPPIHSSPPILEKLPNHVKLCFIARIHSIKNLHFLLEILKGVKINIILSVIGNAEDTKYTAICKQIALTLPLNIKVVFLGGLAHDEVNIALGVHHLFVLPTLGETYGHDIIEALSVGRPVLISDQTPWKNLKEYNAGWELPLSAKQAWSNAIEEAAWVDQAEFDKHCEGALAYAKAHTNNEELVKKYVEMFGGETTEGTKWH